MLVGATPQLVAQSVVAKDGQNSVEDGLYPQVNFADSVVVYLQDVESFIAELRRLRAKQGLDLKAASFTVAQSTQLPCVASNRAGSYTAETLATSLEALRPLLERYTRFFTDGYALSDCLRTDKFPDITTTHSRFELKADRSSFSISVAAQKATPERAVELSRLLPTTFDKYRETVAVSLRNQIIKATSISAQNDQVFVITRLPRAGLDQLLASDAK